MWPSPGRQAALSIAEKTVRSSLIRRLGQSIAEWRLTQKGIRHLECLDDRMLADIGISRTEIYNAAARGRERSPFRTI